MEYPHDIAYDPIHRVFATEDTENDAENFYTFDGKNFNLLSRLEGLGRRTHRTIFDESSKQFLILTATGDFFHVSLDGMHPKITSKMTLPFDHKHHNAYEIRSFVRHDGNIFFVSSMADPHIYVIKDSKELKILNRIPVSKSFANMQTLYFLPDGHVMVSSGYKKFAILDNIQ